MQLANQLDTFLLSVLLRQGDFGLAAVLEPVVEEFGLAEYFGEEEVEQAPELVQVVLEGGASQQQFALGVEFADDLGELTVLVLDLVGFVNDDVVPLDLLQTIEADSDPLEGGHDDVKLALVHHVGQDLLALITGSD